MIRVFDILFSGIAIIALSPLLIITIIILRFSGEGEIFYFQSRIGKSKKIIKLYKFATMRKDSESRGSKTITIKDDPRILPVGKFLRKSKINELPQLFNVFLGSMSLVGPRPLTQETFNLYEKFIQDEIASVKPGLSGVGSIFFRNEEELIPKDSNFIEFYKTKISPIKGRIELWFCKNNNLLTYFSVIFITAYLILFKKSKLHYYYFKSIRKILKGTILEK